MDHSGIFGASVYCVGTYVRIGDNQGFENDYRRNNRGVNRMAEKELFGNSEQLDCSDCVNHGGDWDCDHVQCHKGADTISRVVESVPSAQQWIPCKTAFPEKENTRVTYQTNAGVIIIDGIYGGIDAYGHRVWLDRERGLYWDDEVVAWMPIVIPEPWKGEKP